MNILQLFFYLFGKCYMFFYCCGLPSLESDRIQTECIAEKERDYFSLPDGVNTANIFKYFVSHHCYVFSFWWLSVLVSLLSTIFMKLLSPVNRKILNVNKQLGVV